MTSLRIAIVLLAAAACGPTQAPTEEGTKQQAIEFCGSKRVELKMSPPLRLRSTGLISNGCTGVLLDAEHVLAAAHCFNDIDGTGNWQLVAPWHPANPIRQKFYPNFHPDRVLASPSQVPRGDIDRAVVGSRTHPYPAADWGIGHIARWHDVNPADLTFAQLDGTLENAIVHNPAKPDTDTTNERGPIETPAYARGAFGPRADLHFDNFTCTGDYDNNGSIGIWALDRRQEPAGEQNGCNQRWMAGSVFSDCDLVTVRDDVVFHDCESWGGSSGAPLLREKNGIVSVVGVQHGYSSPTVAAPTGGTCTQTSDCGSVTMGVFCDNGACKQLAANDQIPWSPPQCIANSHTALNVGASASRFLHAPRFASNVAVARRPDGDDATGVFAVDSDLDKVVFRERAGDLHSSPFTFWKPTPTVGGNEATLTRIAACSDSSGHPMVFVVGKQKGTNASRLFRTRFDPTIGDFLGWVPVTLQNLDSSIDEDLVDIDAAYDDKGRCLLFALDRGEKTIAFTDMSVFWSQPTVWQTINATSGPATGTSLTALRSHDGYLWVTTIDAGGKLWALAQQCAGSPNFWFTYPNIPDRHNVSKWRDVDGFRSSKGEGKLIALPESLEHKILVQFDLPSRTCNKWDVNGVPTQPFNDVPIQTTLWTPNVTTTTLGPYLTTLTADHWLEDKPGDTSPVIFGTDDFGNVYFISNTVGTGGWRLKWQSFNHEWLFYP